MNEANKVRLGAFLLISMILLIVGFIYLGTLDILKPKVQAMTIINTSVEGLNVGSPVKYKGLPIGKITKMTMNDDNLGIDVYFEIPLSSIDASSLEGLSSLIFDEDPNDWSQENISELGFVCFLNASGIMGGSFLELASMPGDKNLISDYKEVEIPKGVVYIPSRASYVGNVIENISHVLDNLASINLIEFSKKIDYTLEKVDSIFNEGELLNTMKTLNSISENADRAITQLGRVANIENANKINDIIDNADLLIIELNKTLNSNNMNKTLNNINSFMVTSQDMLHKTDKYGQEFSSELKVVKIKALQTMIKLDNFMKQLSILLQQLSDNPNQFIRGKAPAVNDFK